MKCPKCNHENRDGAKFCEECGEKLQSVHYQETLSIKWLYHTIQLKCFLVVQHPY